MMKSALLATLLLAAPTPALACAPPPAAAAPQPRSVFVQDLAGKPVSLAGIGAGRPVLVVFLRHFG